MPTTIARFRPDSQPVPLRRHPSCLGRITAVLIAAVTAFAGSGMANARENVEAERTAPFSVQVHGAGGSPVFLIPGLGSPGSVWEHTVSALVERGYEAHVFTLAGFAGQPSVEGDLLPRVHAELIRSARRLEEPPALVGHSLGAVMSFWLAASEPKLFGPVVAVDGVPFLPALTDPTATAESARPQAEALHAMISGMTPAAFDQQTAFTLSTMVTQPAEARRLAEQSRGSDPQVIAAAMRDLMTRDLRQAVAAIESPVLLIGAGAPATTPQAAEELAARYRAQVAAVPQHRVEMIADARHFVMVDDPERFLELTLIHLDGGSSHGLTNSER